LAPYTLFFSVQLLGNLTIDTERHSSRYSGIDQWSSTDALDAMIEGQFVAIAAVRTARAAIDSAAEAMEGRLNKGGRLIYVGAGTSGRLAVQDGAELMPTFGWPSDRLLLWIAGGREALLRAVEGAEDSSENGGALVNQHRVQESDVLIAVAASGTTPFTLACMRAAKAKGALTIGIANNAGTPLITEAEYPIFLDTGPEPIAGSTRMKAGAAQRATLTLLSSLLMIRMGRVYDGLMVNVQATNDKLVRRSAKMLMHLTGGSVSEVQQALATANGDVKLAMLLLKGAASLEDAKRALDKAQGRLRSALALLR
jgi:N-acetylmuramic acid 6-phosphate etherase